MSTLAVVKTGGKQYLVKEGDIITVDRLPNKEKETVALETLAIFDNEKDLFELGTPKLTKATKSQVVTNLKGDKIRVAKFKAKVRYRRVKGFRPMLTKIKILRIANSNNNSK
jgi:large subunit ribosomal protein L21